MTGVYVIAEAGVNHNGSREVALQMVDVAAEAGVDAIKFQTFKAERMVSRTLRKADYQARACGTTETQFDMLRALELSKETHRALRESCANKGVDFLSTPFDCESIDFLVDELNVACLKIASGEITNGPLLLYAARKSKPIVLSTGMSTLVEVGKALEVLALGMTVPDGEPRTDAFEAAFHSEAGQEALRDRVTLLQCTSEYPSFYEDVNLRAMDTLRTAFGLRVGLSDHSQGILVPIAAVALGAGIIEKHFTLSRSSAGPDHAASLEPDELKSMVNAIRIVEKAMGNGCKEPAKSELNNLSVIRRGLVAARPIKAGELFSAANMAAKRPALGPSPMEYWDLIGRPAPRDFNVDESLHS